MAYIGKKPSDITRAIATYDSFTGDGSTTTFTLSQGAASANDLTVVVNNVRQEPGTGSKSYTFNGPTSLVFNTAPAASDEIYVINPTQVESIVRAGDISSGVITGQTEESTVNDADHILMFDASASALRKITKANFAPSVTLTYTSGTATGDGSTVAFTINSGRAVANVLAIVNGAILIPTADYTISGTTLTFATAPAGGAEIQFRYLPISA
tara:strand:+ start:223 stop:858 length:636 start_codon:yes stop_codon:yes gene_type:complete